MARTLRLRRDRRTLAHARGVSVALADAVAASVDDSPKWVQVTREGNFPGYMGGARPFSFTRADLATMVANIKSHPSYQLDANGKPVGQVIPWDFNHASEQDPTTGALPVAGSPAQGWTLDLEIRNNPEDGHAELWALTKFLEPARTYVRMGQYKWASVAVQLNAVDPTSGQTVGACVTSIALTNTPFVEGMETLVATKNPKQPRQAADVQAYRREFFQAAQDADEAICDMRCLFGLPETAGAAEVMNQLGIVAGWYVNGGAPLGTDPEYIVGSLRTILNLPTLMPDADVLAEAGKSVQMLVQQQMVAAGLAVPNQVSESGTVPPSPMPQVAASKGREEAMAENLLKVLASMLGVRESEDAAVAAIKDLVSLRAGIQEVFKLERDSTSILLGAAKDGAAAKEKLLGLFTALGVEKPEEAVAKVAQVMQSAAQLKEVMPELESMRIEKATQEEAAVETEVDQAIAASKLPTTVKPALMLFRKTDPKAFREQYKLAAAPVAPVAPVHLTQAKVTELTQKVTVRDGQVQVLPQDGIVDLSKYPGANPTARAKAYLSATVQGFDKLTNDQQFLQAVSLKKQPHVIDSASSAQV